jgi:uncharacterized protein (TIGR00375 family)
MSDKKEQEKEIIADLHVHSRFSRATSSKLNIQELEKFAKIKGIDLLGTGDFQHPEWFKELERDLVEEREGIVYTKNRFPFLWQTEISLMYSQGGKGRRIHYVILAPSKEVVKQITKWLGSKGRLDYDGRPIFGFSSIELVEQLKRIDDKIEIIPAHCLTPWFGIFGSKGGFDSLKECFQDKADKIYAVESGISADPEMLRKFSFLNNKSVVSFSDLHSFWPWRMGRENTIFKGKLTYDNLIKQIRENSFKATIETEPAYGRYHWDGHRNCNFSCSPEKTKELGGICPKCHQKLTIGVENRVEELADQETEEHPDKKPFYKLLPLHELIALAKGTSISTKTVWHIYNQLIDKFQNEFNVLLNVEKEKLLREISNEQIVGLIMDNRKANLKIKPGYDGNYGKVLLKEKQGKLF